MYLPVSLLSNTTTFKHVIKICIIFKETSYESVTYIQFLVRVASNRLGILCKVHLPVQWICSLANLLLFGLLLVILFAFVKELVKYRFCVAAFRVSDIIKFHIAVLLLIAD